MRKNIKKNIKKVLAIMCVSSLVTAGLAGCGSNNNSGDSTKSGSDAKSEAFTPSLDTEKETSLEIAGALGNFEALDQVVNDFNEYYPNVTVSYEQNDVNNIVDYLENNKYIDIFMTNATNISKNAPAEANAIDYCLDLSKEDIDMSAIDTKLLDACTVDDSLARMPIAKLMCGIVVNKTLLMNEGLEVPTNYQEFMDACETLKQKGYIPIQSARNHVCSDLVLPMAMDILADDDELIAKVAAGDKSYADSLKPVYEKLAEIVDNGYMSKEINETYPEDNYDGAIMTFFEGKVPFWVVNTESVSGMRKRESKSEAFSAEPFDYEFINAPLGDDGVYDYEEPWYGFSISKNSDNIDYAVEFMRFLAQKDELNKLAEVKGIPSAAVDSDDPRYNNALHPENCISRYVYDGQLSSVNAIICDTANKMGYGDLKTADEAVEFLKSK